MGKYGFTGKGALWQQVYRNQRKMDKSYSHSNNIAKHTETGDLHCPTTAVNTPEDLSSTEKNVADCLSRMVVAMVKYREAHIECGEHEGIKKAKE
ncbi:MAG: hypothetical protein ACI4RK_07840 [Oscillospiraceae bacterium]